MDHDFWHTRWRDGQIGFHEGHPNAHLTRHFKTLFPAPARVFVPLCGKAIDLHWLRDQGYEVAGVELNETAVKDLFAEIGLSPEITEHGPLKRYTAPNMTIYVGDIFDLDAETLGPVEAIYDRAALVALPDDMRGSYATHLTKITRCAPQFLITFIYDQTQMAGPPFSVDEVEVMACYVHHYHITQITTAPVANGLKGMIPAHEDVWHLTARD